jgi:hypothetical protein
MARTITGDDPTATAFFTDVDGDMHQNGASYFGAEGTEGAEIKGIYDSGTIVVAVPNITDPDIAKVDVDISALTFAAAVGDAVIARPTEALPTNCRLGGAWVSATDTVTITFGSEGGNVTGANKNFKFLLFDLT